MAASKSRSWREPAAAHFRTDGRSTRDPTALANPPDWRAALWHSHFPHFASSLWRAGRGTRCSSPTSRARRSRRMSLDAIPDHTFDAHEPRRRRWEVCGFTDELRASQRRSLRDVREPRRSGPCRGPHDQAPGLLRACRLVWTPRRATSAADVGQSKTRCRASTSPAESSPTPRLANGQLAFRTARNFFSDVLSDSAPNFRIEGEMSSISLVRALLKGNQAGRYFVGQRASFWGEFKEFSCVRCGPFSSCPFFPFRPFFTAAGSLPCRASPVSRARAPSRRAFLAPVVEPKMQGHPSSPEPCVNRASKARPDPLPHLRRRRPSRQRRSSIHLFHAARASRTVR